MSNQSINLAILVDDNEVDLFIQRRLIELSQFAQKIVAFTSPVEALGYLQTANGAGSRVVFLDLNMPVVDGFGFMDRLKSLPAEILNEIKIVVLTSSTNLQDKEKAGHCKYVIHYMSKPLTREGLEEIGNKMKTS